MFNPELAKQTNQCYSINATCNDEKVFIDLSDGSQSTTICLSREQAWEFCSDIMKGIKVDV